MNGQLQNILCDSCRHHDWQISFTMRPSPPVWEFICSIACEPCESRCEGYLPDIDSITKGECDVNEER